MTNVLAPVWHSENTLFGFVRQGNGAHRMRSIDPGSGVVRDVGVGLPAGVDLASGLCAHRDADNGCVLLLSRPSSSTNASGSPLEAWLVSFAAATVSAPR